MNTNKNLPHKDTSLLTKNRIAAPILLWITILFGILFTRPLYLNYISNQAELSKQEIELVSLNSEYQSLLDVKNNTWSGTYDKDTLTKILEKFDRAEIISTVMFNDYTEDSYGINPKIFIGNINVWNPSRLPNWLSLSAVSIGIQGRTVDDIVDYITYLTSETKFKFTIEDITLPIDTAPEWNLPDGYSMNLAFGLYTFE